MARFLRIQKSRDSQSLFSHLPLGKFQSKIYSLNFYYIFTSANAYCSRQNVNFLPTKFIPKAGQIYPKVRSNLPHLPPVEKLCSRESRSCRELSVERVRV